MLQTETLPDIDVSILAEYADETEPPCESSKDDNPAAWVVRAICPSCGPVAHLICHNHAGRIANKGADSLWIHPTCRTANTEIVSLERI